MRRNRFPLFWSMTAAWNNFGALEGEDWLPYNPKRRLNNDLWF